MTYRSRRTPRSSLILFGLKPCRTMDRGALIAIRRLRDPDAEFIPYDEIRKWLGLDSEGIPDTLPPEVFPMDQPATVVDLEEDKKRMALAKLRALPEFPDLLPPEEGDG